VLPRRDANRLKREQPPIRVYRGPGHRERILSDIRYADSRQHLV
jgi:hypothetical protein